MPNLPSHKIEALLLKQDYISQQDLVLAQKYSEQHSVSVVDALLIEKIITKELLGQAISEYYNIPFADLVYKRPSKEQILMIPEDLARAYNVVFFEKNEKVIFLASDDPQKLSTAGAYFQPIFPQNKLQVAFGFTEDIQNCFFAYRQPLTKRLTDIIDTEERIAPKIVSEIIKEALELKSSDIHFEPEESIIKIRYRIDGMLQDVADIKKDIYESILNHFKVLAHLRIDQHYSSQDGSLRFQVDEYETDLRISIVPILDGEKIVLRVLSKYVGQLTLEELGLSTQDQEILMSAVKKPFGMILTTGPTGSGKTTTLYALVKILNKSDVNITTIEDPVEYKIKGINQIQVNTDAGLTFAKGLRSIVRQDPNVILVGEIRDKETAEIGVNAALTGHLLLSTFHSNDAATSIPRLLDMGIEAFLLSSTLNLIISQRLARRICESCRYSVEITKEELCKKYPQIKQYFTQNIYTFYVGKGCGICGNTGYKGRVGLFELIEVTPQLQELILRHPSMSQIWSLATSQGSRDFFEDGFAKVLKGITTLDEILRVAPIKLNVSTHGRKKSD